MIVLVVTLSQSRVTIRDCLLWVGLWVCLWRSYLKLINIGRASPEWVAQFPKHISLSCRSMEKLSGTQANMEARVHFFFSALLTVNVTWPEVWNSCLDIPTMADRNCKLKATFYPQLMFVRTLMPAIEGKLVHWASISLNLSQWGPWCPPFVKCGIWSSQ